MLFFTALMWLWKSCWCVRVWPIANTSSTIATCSKNKVLVITCGQPATNNQNQRTKWSVWATKVNGLAVQSTAGAGGKGRRGTDYLKHVRNRVLHWPLGTWPNTNHGKIT